MESSVWEEKRYNPRLTKDIDEFVKIMENLNLPYPKKIGGGINNSCQNSYTIYIPFRCLAARQSGVWSLRYTQGVIPYPEVSINAAYTLVFLRDL